MGMDMKGYCTICDGEKIKETSVYPTDTYFMGKVFCSDACEKHLRYMYPSFILYTVILFNLHNNFKLDHDNGIQKTTSNNNHILYADNKVFVYADNPANAIQCIKWIFPGYDHYIVMT